MRRYKKIMMLILAVVFALGHITASFAEDVYKIGAILPLTGPAAFYGEWGMKGIMLAVDEINSQGGINGKKIEVIYGDSKNEPKEGVSWMNRFISDDIPIVISAMTGVSFSVMPIAEKNNTTLFMTIVTHPEATNKSRIAFRHYVNKGKAARIMADFANKTLGFKKIALLYINDEGGLGEKQSFQSEFEGLGGKIVFEESFDKTETDLKNHLLKLASYRPEALYISGYGKVYGLAIKQIHELKLKFKILASYEPLYKTTRDLAGPSLDGVYFTMPLFEESNIDAKRFMDLYIKKYGIRPELDAAFGYDVIKMIALAIQNGSYSSEGIRGSLLKIKKFRGSVGNVAVEQNRDTSIPIVIRTIKEGNILPIQIDKSRR